MTTLRKSIATLFRGISAAVLLQLCTTVALSSCSDNDDDSASGHAKLYDIVEFTSQSSSGTVFSLWQPEATEAVTLTSSSPAIDTSIVEPGEAVFLAYTPVDGVAGQSCEITVSTYGTVNNGKLQKTSPEKLEGWDTEPVYLLSLWRAGGKVCMRLRMTYDATPRLFSLVMDETTADDAYPTAYLYHRRPDNTPNFSRQYYAAFDVSSLWVKPGCKGLRIMVANSNNPELGTFIVENPWPVESATAQST